MVRVGLLRLTLSNNVSCIRAVSDGDDDLSFHRAARAFVVAGLDWLR
jgi:hypothetical protein